MDLTTNYLGLTLKNPLVPSASPLSHELDAARRLEDAGAAALVMYSLFEESLQSEERSAGDFLEDQSIGHAEATSFIPVHGELPSSVDRYLEQLQRLKGALGIPVVASLNGISRSGWLEYGKELERAGADALELNIYYVAADPDLSGADVEQRYVDLVRELRAHVGLPINVKLSPQFSSVSHMVGQLEGAGADGVSLFNRFYQPDIDLDSLKVGPHLQLSSSVEALLPMRWIALLFGRVGLTLGHTSGIHSAEDALKALLAGADVVHLCSALLKRGPGYLAEVLAGIEQWLEESPYETLEQMRGCLSAPHAADPAAYARANYVDTLATYTQGVDWNR